MQVLLAQTLASIERHHPEAAYTLVLDNASPSRAAVGAAVGPAKPHQMRIRHVLHSLGQLGAYAAAERLLRGDTSERLAHPEAIETIVLLQHSTALAGPVHMPRGCAAAALSTMVNASTGGGWLDPNEYGMRWASAVAEAVGIPCAPPCTRGQLPARFSSTSASTQGTTLKWAAASHGVLALSRSAFDALCNLRLWPSPDGTRVRAGSSGQTLRGTRSLPSDSYQFV